MEIIVEKDRSCTLAKFSFAYFKSILSTMEEFRNYLLRSTGVMHHSHYEKQLLTAFLFFEVIGNILAEVTVLISNRF